jgi:hypothetical protein
MRRKLAGIYEVRLPPRLWNKFITAETLSEQDEAGDEVLDYGVKSLAKRLDKRENYLRNNYEFLITDWDSYVKSVNITMNPLPRVRGIKRR